MLKDQIFYHGTIRRVIVAFGSLFSNIYIDRKQGDSVNGDQIQRLQVPLAYGPKEKWMVRLEQDPNLGPHTYASLPRMSFEINSYDYDSSRKINKMNKIICNDGTSSSVMYSPVPYNLNITLSILTKTTEDSLQIIEQILPTFTPEYTLSINVIPEMNVIQDVPIVLNSVSVMDDYEGDFQTRRFVTYTLSFTAKMNLFGFIQQNKQIYTTYANINTAGLDSTNPPSEIYTAVGDPVSYDVTFEGWDS